MSEPVDGDDGESVIERSMGTDSISAELNSLGETPIEDDPIESIRSDYAWEVAVDPSEKTSGNR